MIHAEARHGFLNSITTLRLVQEPGNSREKTQFGRRRLKSGITTNVTGIAIYCFLGVYG
jgi:hypothetical protein